MTSIFKYSSKAFLLLLLTFSTSSHEYHETDLKNEKFLNDGNIFNIHRGRNEIILTIDDGPTPGVTNKILDTLKKYKVKASFFVSGYRVASNKPLLQRMRDEGHIVANHTFNHKNIKNLNPGQIRNEFIKSHNAILPYTRNSRNYYFRAPGGSWKAAAAKVANSTSFGYNLKGPLYWDIGGNTSKSSSGSIISAADWQCWNSKVPATYLSVSNCLNGYINETKSRRGGVVLFHDLNVKTAELIERYVRYFKNDSSYSFATLDDADLEKLN